MMTTPPPNLPPEAPEALTQHRRRSISDGAVGLLLRDHTWQIVLFFTLITNIALFVYLGVRFATLPDRLPLHFDTTGLPDRIEVKSGIFALPLIGLTVIGLNIAFGILLHRHERTATMLLTTGALLVQILMWLATINILGGFF